MRIVFKREDPDSPDLLFVEVENDRGESIHVGTWKDEGDGFEVLEIPDPSPPVNYIHVNPPMPLPYSPVQYRYPGPYRY